ncbi:protein stoned-B-like [Vespula squamosa]|uniref:Protein stoned-B-like n=1 Tax=Vespula squamosa TaxID=30214 RepID=A0ABD2ADI3_VESSQ
MDSKGGNPFLMDDYTSEPDNSVAGQQELNPFLESFTDTTTSEHGENPFLNITSDQSYQAPVNVESTNPFASFCEENIFNLSESTKEEEEEKISEPTQAAPIQAKNGKPPPSRPPPPRPQPPPPPPKNTKDLILSVTGAMDATSNHLLDRLQATRTPSPTLMHSPSPTPEHSFADFLDVDGNVPDLIPYDNEAAEAPKSSQDILDLFDGPNTDTTATASFSVDTTNLITDVTVTSATQENPFVSITDQEIESTAPAEGAFSSYYPEAASISVEKRASVSSTMGFPIQETEKQAAVDLDFSKEASVPTDQLTSVTTAELFSTATTEQISTTVESPFFSISDSTSTTQYGVTKTSVTSTTQQISQPIFSMTDTQQNVYSSDLLGDFDEPTKEVGGLISTSPIPAAEYPGTDTQLDNFVATTKAIESTGDAFDAFASKFDKAAEPEANADPFLDAFGNTGPTAMDTSSDVWGDSSGGGDTAVTGFEESDGFDSFLSMTAPPQPETKVKRADSGDSDEGPDFSVFIKPKEGDQLTQPEVGPVPALAPPPKSPQNSAYADSSSRFNPFDKTGGFAQEAVVPTETAQPEITRTDSQANIYNETPPTPLFDEDVSQPLEDFPRVTYTGDGWEMQLRQPNKKKITGQRFWKKIFVKLVYQGDNPVLQLFNGKDDKDPFQELPLLACYSVSDIGAQQFDQYGKIFTVKLQYIFYKERPGVRPGQVTKAERLTNKLSQFAAYAIQGDYQGVKEFGSDLKKLGLPVEHAAQISQLFKLGSQNYEDMKTFSCAIEEALFRLSAHRDRALSYKMEEVQISVVDEIYVEQSAEGHVDKQIARVRLFFLGFLSGMPDVELGINDMWRQGKEVVGRHDIIPVVTEEWIRLENVEFHACVQQDEYEKSRIIKFKPPDACYIELMRFRVRPPKNRELPLQLKAVMCVTGNKVELRADILVPGFASRKLGQIPCEDVMVRFPIPECWIYLFRVEKHFRYGSVKSAHRRTGKIKGIERFLGAVDTLEPQLMEVTSGQAKYEHQHRAIVWRMPRLPKEGQGAYTTHQLVCRMALTSYDQIPENLAEYCYVEFTMPATQVSHTTARSVSLQNSDSDAPPEKYVRNLSRHEYRVGIEHTQGEGPGAYVTATLTKKIPETTPETHGEVSDTPAESDSDSSE